MTGWLQAHDTLLTVVVVAVFAVAWIVILLVGSVYVIHAVAWFVVLFAGLDTIRRASNRQKSR